MTFDCIVSWTNTANVTIKAPSKKAALEILRKQKWEAPILDYEYVDDSFKVNDIVQRV